jgi:hypothetical protein
VVKDITFSLPAGSTCAIVGAEDGVAGAAGDEADGGAFAAGAGPLRRPAAADPPWLPPGSRT